MISVHKVTIEDHDYDGTTYTAWVQASSKQAAVAAAGALAGAEKAVAEFHRTGRGPLASDGQLSDPQVKVEPGALQDFYDHEYEVVVNDHRTPRT